ncbi:signal peptidase II [Chloroflexota bacterium]
MERTDLLSSRYNLIFLAAGVCILAADQLTKTWIRANLALGDSVFDLGFFRIYHGSNTGAAFGIFQEGIPVLRIVSVIGLVAVLGCGLFSARFIPFFNKLAGKLALGLVLGGVSGNMVDRVWRGQVTDFLDFLYWPAFNVADASLVIGCALLVLLLFREMLRERAHHGEGT